MYLFCIEVIFQISSESVCKQVNICKTIWAKSHMYTCDLFWLYKYEEMHAVLFHVSFGSYINGAWTPDLKWCWNVQEMSLWLQLFNSFLIIVVVYVFLCAPTRLWSYQHDHTPVEDSSVISVTTGWTQQRFLCLMTAKKREKDEFSVGRSKVEEVEMLPSMSQHPKRINTSCLLGRHSPPLSPTPERFYHYHDNVSIQVKYRLKRLNIAFNKRFSWKKFFKNNFLWTSCPPLLKFKAPLFGAPLGTDPSSCHRQAHAPYRDQAENKCLSYC